MNRRTITLLIVSGIITIGLIVGGLLLQYYGSFHKVTVTVKDKDITVDVYHQVGINPEDGKPDDPKIASVKGSQTLSLQAGTYYAIPQGDKYDTSPTNFTVADKDISVTVDPPYSSTYLTSLLQQELPAIKGVITAKYPQASTNFTLNDGKLYKDGTWYGTTLIQNAEAGNNGDVYRTILHKVNGVWEFAAAPEIVFSALVHKDIPQDILSDINSQSGY